MFFDDQKKHKYQKIFNLLFIYRAAPLAFKFKKINLIYLIKKKGATGIEPATMGSAIPCSTTELYTHKKYK